jgi:MFS family permease
VLTVLRRRDFALVWSGGLISLTGDWLLLLALPVYVYTLTGSTLSTGSVFIVDSLTRLLLGTIAGLFVDRWDRRRTMVIANVLQAAVLLPLVLVRSVDTLWLVYPVVIVRTSIAQFFAPAESAFIPTLVERHQLVPANALNGLSQNLSRLVGPALGGILVTALGLGAAAVGDAVSFVASAALISLVRPGPVRSAGPDSASVTERGWRVLARDWMAGPGLLADGRLAFTYTAVVVQATAEGILGVLVIAFVRDVISGGGLELGWMLSAQAVGGVIGGVVIGRTLDRVRPFFLAGLGLVALGLIDLAIWNSTALSHILLLFALAGPAAIAFGAGLTTLLQTIPPASYRGRAFGLRGATLSLGVLVGLAIASLLGNALGAVPLLEVSAALNVLGGVILLTAGVRSQRAESSSAALS